MRKSQAVPSQGKLNEPKGTPIAGLNGGIMRVTSPIVTDRTVLP
ncbi:hypothetical protein [Flavobacterium sp.]